MAESISFGVTVSLDGSELNNVTEVKPPSIEREFSDTTHHGLPNRWRTQRPTLTAGGDCEITMQQDTTNTSVITALLDSDVESECIVTMANNETATFSCYVKSFDIEAQTVDGIMMSKLVLAVTGFVSVDGDVS